MTDSSIELVPYSETSPHLKAGVRVYALTWGYDDKPSLKFFREYTRKEGFLGVVALEHGEVVAIAFGVKSVPGNWWHDKVALHLGEHHAALKDAWVLVEIAVLPSYRGQGIGQHMIDYLTTRQPYSNLLLSTQTTNFGARRLYEKLGWSYLHDGIQFYSDNPTRFVIMHRPRVQKL
ncbi:GNAT family N-acetyltransferase [Deinococcus misasensis]|uniref:GNAT family N-acetyltransferase n=1 Tax=Deinococcus misasensis TaxID=392413 RepID=UPI00068EAC68|nr:GNAT family N-acetyltransferase [Deinococcus misasensis]